MSRLQELSGAELKERLLKTVNRLKQAIAGRGAVGRDDAELRRPYREEVLPLEKERVRRQGLEREPVDLLFVTVGTQADAPTPALLGAPARRVVMLHTCGSG